MFLNICSSLANIRLVVLLLLIYRRYSYNCDRRAIYSAIQL